MTTYEDMFPTARATLDRTAWLVSGFAPAEREYGIVKIQAAFVEALGADAAAEWIQILRSRVAQIDSTDAGNA